MNISFKDAKLEALCNTERLQQQALGAAARRLRTRLAELAAAERVTDLVNGRPHPLRGDRLGQFSVSLDSARRLVFVPTHDPAPLGADGTIAWDRVSSIRIVFIGDYHD